MATVNVFGADREVPSGWSVVTSGVIHEGDRIAFKNGHGFLWEPVTEDEIGDELDEQFFAIRRDSSATEKP
jgi:hypothetical protein